MKFNPTTYEQYMDLIADSSPARLQKESHIIIERFKSLQYFHPGFIPTIFFVDYTTRQYVYVDKNCMQFGGYPDSYYYQEGHEGFLRRTHPSEYAIVNTKIFPVNLDYLKKYPAEKYRDLVFTHNFRFRSAEEKYIVLLQRCSYVPNKTASGPAGVIGVVYDITHFKTGINIVHTIEETEEYNGEIMSKLIYKATYPVYDLELELPLSNRELEILKKIAEGVSSKQISKDLAISINTVNNHRKRMLQKTNCKTPAELLAYATKHGII